MMDLDKNCVDMPFLYVDITMFVTELKFSQVYPDLQTSDKNMSLFLS